MLSTCLTDCMRCQVLHTSELWLAINNFFQMMIMNGKAVSHLVRAEQLWKAAFGGLAELPREPGRITVSYLDGERLIDLLKTSKQMRQIAQSALTDQSMYDPERLKEYEGNAVALNIRLKHGGYPPKLVSQIFEDAVLKGRSNIVRVLLRRRFCGDLQLNLDRFIHPTDHGKPPLILSISCDPLDFNEDIAQRLIEAGADVNKTIHLNNPVFGELQSVLDWILFMAWITNDENFVPFVRYLLQKGADYRLMGTLEDLDNWPGDVPNAVARLIRAQARRAPPHPPPRSKSDPIRRQSMPHTEGMSRHPSA